MVALDGLALNFCGFFLMPRSCDITKGRIQIDIPTRVPRQNLDDFMTINKISIGKRTFMFSFYFNFNINVLGTRMHSSRMSTAPSSSRLLRGGCLPQCMLGYPPGVGLEIPLGVDLETPPGCGPGVPTQGQTPQLPPWMWAWRPAMHAGIPTPHCVQTDTCKNITFANG